MKTSLAALHDPSSDVEPEEVSRQYLLQRGLQELLPLLGLEQQALPALVELIQLIPQVARLVTRRGLQQLGGSAVHRLHCGMMGQHVVA